MSIQIMPSPVVPVRLDLRYLHHISEGDIAFEHQILKLYLRDVPKALINIRKALQHKKHQIAADIIHKLRSKIQVLGLKKALQLAKNIELNLRNNVAINEIIDKVNVFFVIIKKSVFLAQKELQKRTKLIAK